MISLTSSADILLEEQRDLKESLMSAIKKNYTVVKTPKTMDDFSNFYNKSGSVYTDDGKWEISSGHGTIYITDLTNALVSGKTMDVYKIQTDSVRGGRYPLSVINGLRDVPFTKVLKAVKSGKEALKALYDDEVLAQDLRDVRVEGDTKGQNYFSPFAVGKLKRVSKLPAKPNRTHLIKLIANGQFSHLTNDFEISRDGEFPDKMDSTRVSPMWLLEQIVSWRDARIHVRSVDGKTVFSFGPHSNSSYTLVVDLNGKLRIRA